jgi:uncharacterized protein (DUF58 family)
METWIPAFLRRYVANNGRIYTSRAGQAATAPHNPEAVKRGKGRLKMIVVRHNLAVGLLRRLDEAQSHLITRLLVTPTFERAIKKVASAAKGCA